MTTRQERCVKRQNSILEAFRKIGTIKGTARRLRVSRRAIRLALRGDNPPVPKPPTATSKKSSKLDPFKAIVQRLVQEDQLSATLIFDEIRELGYPGGYSTLKGYVRTVRPDPRVKVTTRLIHEPGSAAQVDLSAASGHAGR